jgi:uncharacterized protein YaeQ
MYRFSLQVSDIDRGVYETKELRVAMHPSESLPYFLTRVIAYALNLQEGLEMGLGISTPDDPPLFVRDLTGVLLLWIDIGNPSARRLHKAAKAAKKVRVYTYRDPAILQREMEGEQIHRSDEIEVFSLPPSFFTQLAATLERDNPWELLCSQAELSINIRSHTVSADLQSHRLAKS